MTIWLTCIVLAAALLAVAGSQIDYINTQRSEMGLISNPALENAPPSLAFATVAMGAFRGLVVDILWMRAEALKEEGQFFDARQLAEWITALQPRFAAVWDFHSWNMAYNISVAIPATQPQERWRWVKNGYELLRDQGIPTNPNSIILYRQLAMIFQHKIGGVTDEANAYYKLQLASAMEPLLGSADDEFFQSLAEAPTDLGRIMADANVASFVEALRAADAEFESDNKLVSNYLSLRQNADRFKPEALNTIDDFRGTSVLEKFDVFAKAYHLRSAWKLEPDLMQELNRLYGPIDWSDPNRHLPLDWKHPDSHAIYWAVKGLRKAAKKEGRELTIDETNTDRIVVHSLQNLFRYGKILVYEPRGGRVDQSGIDRREVFLRPDLRMFDVYNKVILSVIDKYAEPNEPGKYNSHKIGHRNMLKNAVLSFYQSGHKAQALKIYNQMRRLYPMDESKVPLHVFVRNRFIEELKVLHIVNVREIVQMLLRESYFLYAIRDDDGASGSEKLAKEVYDYYYSINPDEVRIDMKPFGLLKYTALIDVMSDEQFSNDLRRSLSARIRIERPDVFKQLEKQDQLQNQTQQPN